MLAQDGAAKTRPALNQSRFYADRSSKPLQQQRRAGRIVAPDATMANRRLLRAARRVLGRKMLH
jgi:hypothetical protein